MKTLKKTLSLTLVFALVFSLMSMAFAAETTTTSTSSTGFTDAASIQYKESVEVMTGIGAINGYTDGSVKPQGSITREEAAKMITYAVLGKDVADKLTVSNTGFTDVASDRWSAPYIAYLVGKGVISGMGDGTFAPAANVTGYQMAKMMLCAAGYGANGEFTGTGWELSVAVAANKAGIFDDANVTDYTKAATREEAMLYAFNGIMVPQVEYNKVFGTYLGKGQGINGKVSDAPTIADETYGTNLKKDAANVDGVSSYTWFYNGKAISGVYSSAKVLATSTDGTTIADLTNPAKSAYIGYQPNTADQDSTTAGDQKVAYYLNGDFKGYDDASTVNASVKRGAIVKFLDTTSPADNKYDVISVTLDTVSKVTSVKTTTSGSKTYVSVTGVLGLANVDADNVFGFEGLAKDDYVLWHKDNTGRFFLTKAETFTGTVNAVNSAVTGKEVIVVDGAQYKLSQVNSTDAITAFTATNVFGQAGSTFVKDAGGNLCKVVAAEDSITLDTSAFVLNVETGTFTQRAQLLKADGSTAIVTVSKVDSSAADATNVTALKGKFVSFVANSDSTYTLKNIATTSQKTFEANDAAGNNNTAGGTGVTDATDTMATITKGTANFLKTYAGSAADTWDAAVPANVLATASTAFTYRNETTKAFATVNGISAAASYTAVKHESVIAYMLDSSGYVSWVVAYGGVADNTTQSADYVFVALPGSLVFNTNGSYYTFAPAVVNGELKTIDALDQVDSATNDKLSLGVLTTVASYSGGKVATTNDGGGLIATTAELGGTVSGLDDFVFNGSTVAAKNNGSTVGSFIVTDTTKYFIYDTTASTPTLTAATADDINALSGDAYSIQGIKTSSTDTRIAQLFVTVSANNDTDVSLTATKTAEADATATVAAATGNSGDAARTIAITGTTASKNYTLKLTADPNATVYYSSTDNTDASYSVSTGTETVATGSGTTVYFKVVTGTLTTVYTVTVTNT